MTIRLHVLGAVSALAFFSAPAFSATETFDNPIVLSPTQAAGTWYTDRYAPAGFASQVSFLGDNRLKQSISAADAQTPANNFYNTQGRKYDLAPGTTSASIDLYIPTSWSSVNNRLAGFWATGVDASNAVASYPIISFFGTGSGGTFKVWDGNIGYVDLGLPTGFTFGQWQTLSFALNGSNIDYTIGNLTYSLNSGGAVRLDNVILQGYNTPDGVNYDIYWDNLSTPAVPEPTTWALMIAGFAAVGVSMRRRKTNVAFA